MLLCHNVERIVYLHLKDNNNSLKGCNKALLREGISISGSDLKKIKEIINSDNYIPQSVRFKNKYKNK